jgi:4-amino-4-deoxy-L-arabinose transferase-like glycosyltransferase
MPAVIAYHSVSYLCHKSGGKTRKWGAEADASFSLTSPLSGGLVALTSGGNDQYNSGVIKGLVSEQPREEPQAGRRKYVLLLALGIGIRIFVFLFQDPFNNDLHIQVIQWIRLQGSLPLASQFSQAYHPPLYYLLAQLFYLGDLTYSGYKLLQMFSLLTSLLAFVVLFQMVCRFIRSERVRFTAGLFTALLPQLIMFGNYVSNESLAIFLGALLFLQAYAFIDKPSLANKIGLALLLGLGLLAKGTFLAFLPLVLGLTAVVEWRARKRAGAVLASLALMAALSLAVGSYKYVESYLHFGNPFIHNTDPLIQKATGWPWANSQKNTSLGLPSYVDWNIGKLMLRPTLDESTRHSYFLLLYGTFWYQYIPESNLEGNKTAFRYLGSVIYLLALAPTLMMILGVYALGRKLKAAWRKRSLEGETLQQLFSVLVLGATLGLVVSIGIRTDVWSCFQSRLVFPAFWGLVVLFSSGLDIIERHRRLASAVHLILRVLFICFGLYFVSELLILLGLPV